MSMCWLLNSGCWIACLTPLELTICKLLLNTSDIPLIRYIAACVSCALEAFDLKRIRPLDFAENCYDTGLLRYSGRQLEPYIPPSFGMC